MLKQGTYDIEYAEIRGRGGSGRSGRPVSTTPATRVIPITDMYSKGYSKPTDDYPNMKIDTDDYFRSGGGGAFTSYNHFDNLDKYGGSTGGGSTKSVHTTHSVRKMTKSTTSSYNVPVDGMFLKTLDVSCVHGVCSL